MNDRRCSGLAGISHAGRLNKLVRQVSTTELKESEQLPILRKKTSTSTDNASDNLC